MKKFGFFGMLALMAITFTACPGPDDNPDLDVVVEDGFYVVGEATAIPSLSADGAVKGLMAAGTNEVDKAKREGMYEKYIALEGGKDFELVLREGTSEVRYGADLQLSDTLEGSDVPQIQVYQGVMSENTKMRVAESGLYHIILDLNTAGDLTDKLIMVVPVEWGVRGAMNGWGYTAMTASAFDKSSMTFEVEATVQDAGQFKFAHSNGWKFQLDQAGLVKAENNLGTNAEADGGEFTSLLPGGKNLPIARGKWKLTLTWNLSAGALEKSFTYASTLLEEIIPTYPDNLYMIGTQFGDWEWDSADVVDMVAVNTGDNNLGEGQFWAVRYIEAGKGFKFNSEKAWGSDFATRATTTGVTVDGGNCFVAESGVYMILIDLKEDKMAVEPADVYGMGDAFGGWTEAAEAAKFTVAADGKTLEATTSASGDLRMYAASSIQTSAWWTREFNVFDGTIVYRAKGGDQAAVPVTAGQKVTLNFNTGVGAIQ